MKSPKEIKNGLLCQYGEELPCVQCAYSILQCRSETAKDALAYIQQLEAMLIEAAKTIARLEDVHENA